MLLRQMLDKVERLLVIGRGYSPGGEGRVLLQRALSLTRQTLWRYEVKKAPAWLLFALLGVVASGGDRARAADLLEQQLRALD